MPKQIPDLQRVLIANAAKRSGLRVLPPPKSVAKNAGTIAKSVKSMLSAGLIETVPAETGDTVWPNSEADERLALVVTAAGLSAIGIGEVPESPKAPKTAEAKTGSTKASSPASPRAGSKLASLIDMLSRKDGATVPEIADATGWQHHSIRGAISGALKKKLGLEVVPEVVDDRGRVYRIVASETRAGRGKIKRAGRQAASGPSAQS